jgi:cbb3-type cytochrome oxidase cytochrome c subunit
MTSLMMRSIAAAFFATLVGSAGALAQDRLVDEGRRAFIRNGCHNCHTVGGVGTPIAPDLSRVGAKYRADYLARWLRDPSYLRPSTHMPAIELTEADIATLAAFLAAQQ